MASFPSIRIEGGLLGPELLDQIVAGDVQGQKPEHFGLEAEAQSHRRNRRDLCRRARPVGRVSASSRRASQKMIWRPASRATPGWFLSWALSVTSRATIRAPMKWTA